MSNGFKSSSSRLILIGSPASEVVESATTEMAHIQRTLAHIMGQSSCTMPEDPTDESIKPVLDCLMPVKKYDFAQTNQAECERLRGTPGEPIPMREHRVSLTFRWADKLYHDLSQMAFKSADEQADSFMTYVLVTAEQNGSW